MWGLLLVGDGICISVLVLQLKSGLRKYTNKVKCATSTHKGSSAGYLNTVVLNFSLNDIENTYANVGNSLGASDMKEQLKIHKS